MRKGHQEKTKEEIIEQLREVEEENRLLWKKMGYPLSGKGGAILTNDLISVGLLDQS